MDDTEGSAVIIVNRLPGGLAQVEDAITGERRVVREKGLSVEVGQMRQEGEEIVLFRSYEPKEDKDIIVRFHQSRNILPSITQKLKRCMSPPKTPPKKTPPKKTPPKTPFQTDTVHR